MLVTALPRFLDSPVLHHFYPNPCAHPCAWQALSSGRKFLASWIKRLSDSIFLNPVLHSAPPSGPPATPRAFSFASRGLVQPISTSWPMSSACSLRRWAHLS